ncbi:MAG: hypothetical protein CV089_06375 [Nitrospira sp. WS110]|nr:hypothetical protein [Nitrospira sp. WS110]
METRRLLRLIRRLLLHVSRTGLHAAEEPGRDEHADNWLSFLLHSMRDRRGRKVMPDLQRAGLLQKCPDNLEPT